MSYRTTTGYERTKSVKTKTGKDQLVHIVIAERVLGRPMPKGVKVHHANGIGYDNRNCNLVICENHQYHSLLHRRMRALAATGNANLLKCTICKKYDELVIDTGVLCRHRKCHSDLESARGLKQRAEARQHELQTKVKK